MTEAKPTLVVHTGGIGDFILACPAIAGLNEERPVELLGRKDRLELAVAGGLATTAYDLERVGFETLFDDPSETLRAFLGRFERVVVWMADRDGSLRRGLEACEIRNFDVHPGLPPRDWTRHASAYYLECLGMPECKEFSLPIPPGPVERDVIIHPGSGSLNKNWSRENYMALAGQVESMGHEVTWCLGPAELEGDRGDPWRTLPEAKRLETDSLVELAGHLAAARMYIGNDSGITHLAAAVGCDTVALFAATNPAVWAPRGPHVRVADVVGMEFSNLLNVISGR